MSQDATCSPGNSFYNRDFYETRRSGARRSAEIILPLVLDLIVPQSAIDVGCATGGWLAVAKQHGVREVLGVDLQRVPDDLLEIASDEFLAYDLCRPLDLGRTFDLVLALEVAEHLPAACADTFLDSLVRLGPAILFSAAIPHQGGTGHLNEQWQGYWVERFRARGFDVIDCVRQRLWQNVDIWPHYAQNTLLFGSRTYVDNHAVLREMSVTSTMPISVVHPKLYISQRNKMLRLVARSLLMER